MAFVWVDSALIEAEKAFIPLNDRGFRYGDGIFDTMRVSNGMPFQAEFHLRRLTQGLAALKIRYDIEALPKYIEELIAHNQLHTGLVRVQITRGSGGRGYLPSTEVAPLCIIETMEAPALPASPVSLAISNYQKISPQALPTHVKLCQGVNSTLARMEAADKNCFDAVMLDQHGHIAETSSANLFWSKDDVLYTPSLATGALEGSVRHWVLQRALAVRQVEASLAALQEANSIYLTNTAWGILPVHAITGGKHPLGNHQLLEELRLSLLSIW
jgi:branched-chain amino acid aminotransferase